ncbi:hypothetical protein ACHMWN_09030 [Pedobacter sp. UC225_61]|uniref:hypothetical protein n=1 Tax=Pedobacter sp. UC225_61 TaxID=3374623 RepID=UPI00379B2683
MKRIKYILSVLSCIAVCLLSAPVSAQVRSNLYYFNNGAPNSTAFLDASSSPAWNNSSNYGKGLIFPRVDLTSLSSLAITGLVQMDNFPSLMDGMIVYNTTFGNSLIGNTAVSPGFYYYKNSSNNLQSGTWTPLSVGPGKPSITDWDLKGNTSIGKGRFIGTQDLIPLIFKVKGIEAARIMVNGNQPGILNLNAPLQLRAEPILSFGRDVLWNNLLVGNIVSSLTGTNNTLLGASSGKNLNAGSGNTLIGALAGSELTDGYENTFIGDNAGTYTTKGSFNTSIGRYAGPVGDLKYATALGNNALAKQNNALILGGTNANKLAIGINTENS